MFSKAGWGGQVSYLWLKSIHLGLSHAYDVCEDSCVFGTGAKCLTNIFSKMTFAGQHFHET